jgi:ubiquinone biosynthesis protein UbiJ
VSAQAPAVATPGNGAPAFAERVRQIRDQAEQLVQELEKLEKDAGKK